MSKFYRVTIILKKINSFIADQRKIFLSSIMKPIFLLFWHPIKSCKTRSVKKMLKLMVHGQRKKMKHSMIHSDEKSAITSRSKHYFLNIPGASRITKVSSTTDHPVYQKC